MNEKKQIKLFFHDLEMLAGNPYSDIHHQQLHQTILRWKKTHQKEDVYHDFLNPTLELFKRLSDMGFPLIYEENDQTLMIIHFESIQRSGFNAGEAFFQIGVTTPGTLSLKFAKYHSDGSIFLQSSVIPHEDEQRLAMDPRFLTTLRAKDKHTGDTLLRFLIMEEMATNKYVIKPTEKVLTFQPIMQQQAYPSIRQAVDEPTLEEQQNRKILNRSVSLTQQEITHKDNSLRNQQKSASFEVETLIKLNIQADITLVGPPHNIVIAQPQESHPPTYSDLFSTEEGYCQAIKETNGSMPDKKVHKSIEESKDTCIDHKESFEDKHPTQESGKPSPELLSKDKYEEQSIAKIDDKGNDKVNRTSLCGLNTIGSQQEKEHRCFTHGSAAGGHTTITTQSTLPPLTAAQVATTFEDNPSYPPVQEAINTDDNPSYSPVQEAINPDDNPSYSPVQQAVSHEKNKS